MQQFRCPRIQAILDNPIAVREWRVLWRRAGDWRIWVGLKWPFDPLVWGAPVVLTYSIAPYGLWAALLLLRRLHLDGGRRVPVDAFLALLMVFWAYVIAISLVLTATAITQERQTQTWDQLRLSLMSRRQRGIGFILGRLGPVWASTLMTILIWWLLQPRYSVLIAALAEFRLSRTALVMGTLIALGTSALVGEIGLIASARSKNGPIAVAIALPLATPFLILTAVSLFAIAMGNPNDPEYVPVLLSLFITLVLFCGGVWEFMVARIDSS
jgi:hypothetical protein